MVARKIMMIALMTVINLHKYINEMMITAIINKSINLVKMKIMKITILATTYSKFGNDNYVDNDINENHHNRP